MKLKYKEDKRKKYWVFYKQRVRNVCHLKYVCRFRIENIITSKFSVQFSHSLKWVSDSGTAACQVSLSITNSRMELLKFMSIELVMPSSHLNLCCPLLLLPSIFPSIRVFSNESVLHIRWPKYCSFSFSISPSNEYSGLISFGISKFKPYHIFNISSSLHVKKIILEYFSNLQRFPEKQPVSNSV